MVELKRIYWSRQALRVAYPAVVVWLGASVVLALMPKANPAGGRSAATAAEVLRGMVDGVLAAVALPGLFVVFLTIVAALHPRQRRQTPGPGPVFQPPAAPGGHGPRRRPVRDGIRAPAAVPAARCPPPAEHGDHFYPWSTGRIHQLAELCRGLCQVQPDEGREGSLARSSGKDGTTTAGVRCVGLFRQRRRAASSLLNGPSRSRVSSSLKAVGSPARLCEGNRGGREGAAVRPVRMLPD